MSSLPSGHWPSFGSQAQPLDDNARTVLRIVAKRDMDGYTLLSYSGLDQETLTKAVESLVSYGYLRVKGEFRNPNAFLDCWFQAASPDIAYFAAR